MTEDSLTPSAAFLGHVEDEPNNIYLVPVEADLPEVVRDYIYRTLQDEVNERLEHAFVAFVPGMKGVAIDENADVIELENGSKIAFGDGSSLDGIEDNVLIIPSESL